MTTTQAILLGLSISAMIIGQLLGWWDKVFNRLQRWLRRWQSIRREKERSNIVYPLHLKTDADIKGYIKKNEPDLLKDRTWGPLLPDMIKEMCAAGWNTSMPFYAVSEEGHQRFYVKTDDAALDEKLTYILEEYEDIFYINYK